MSAVNLRIVHSGREDLDAASLFKGILTQFIFSFFGFTWIISLNNKIEHHVKLCVNRLLENQIMEKMKSIFCLWIMSLYKY